MTYPVLYLFPRTEMESMNSGKAMAHTAHAANAFVYAMRKMPVGHDPVLISAFNEWESSSDHGFGTTIVLEAPWQRVLDVVSFLDDKIGVASGLSTDPTYPYVVSNEVADLIPFDLDTMPRVVNTSGKSTLFRKEDTCAWAFGMKDNIFLSMTTKDFNLHP